MSSTILVTKLFIPTTRPELVHRPRLLERLDGGTHRKLSLISAPAGFGKTTLVTEWLDRLRGDTQQEDSINNRIAWLSLDEGDNDPARFLTYFIAALNQIEEIDTNFGAGSLAMLQSPQPPPTAALMAPLINEIATISDKIIFVVDDYHLIDAQPVQDILSFLLENTPPQLHLVITTREDPLLPLPRLHARGQLTELRAADLRFTNAEAAEFLNLTMRLNLSVADITALETRTEGWIAGLQLAAITLQGQANTSKLIQSFTGTNRLVLDYLIEEVLSQQSEDIQDFLLHTAVLDRLTGSLCDVVRFGSRQRSNNSPESGDGQTILEKLDRANLFVISLDNERRWYRYHHLFADLLRKQLGQTDRQKISTWHTRASMWFEQNGFFDEAIEHAFRAEDFDRGATLLADLADPLWERGEHVKLKLWLAALPETYLCEEPHLCIYQAWFLFSTGQEAAAEKSIQAAENVLGAIPNQGSENVTKPEAKPEPAQSKLHGRLGAIHAMIATWGDDMPEIIRQASLALKHLPPGDPWRNMAASALGDAYYYQGDVEIAYHTRLDILQSCQAEDDLFFYMIANLKVATSLRELGQLDQTIEICQQQLEFAKENGLLQTVFAGWALGLLAVALAEKNELDKAMEFATKSLELTQGGDLSFVGFSHIILTKVHFYSGDFVGAEVTLKILADIHRKSYLPHYLAGSLAAWQARVLLAQNQLENASQLVERHDSDADEKILILYDHVIVVRARILLALGNLDEAASLLECLIEACETVGHTARLIEVLVLQALTKQAESDMLLAKNYLRRALTLAETGGYIRIFVDEGPPMARLLYEALSEGIATDYVQRLLAAFPETEPDGAGLAKTQTPDFEWVEPLSERELDILQLIGEGLTNQEIASKLYISLNTVKAHTRNIYGKLNVHSRTRAIARSQELGLLPSKVT